MMLNWLVYGKKFSRYLFLFFSSGKGNYYYYFLFTYRYSLIHTSQGVTLYIRGYQEKQGFTNLFFCKPEMEVHILMRLFLLT